MRARPGGWRLHAPPAESSAQAPELTIASVWHSARRKGPGREGGSRVRTAVASVKTSCLNDV